MRFWKIKFEIKIISDFKFLPFQNHNYATVWHTEYCVCIRGHANAVYEYTAHSFSQLHSRSIVFAQSVVSINIEIASPLKKKKSILSRHFIPNHNCLNVVRLKTGRKNKRTNEVARNQ